MITFTLRSLLLLIAVLAFLVAALGWFPRIAWNSVGYAAVTAAFLITA